jgi:hypothetical protein
MVHRKSALANKDMETALKHFITSHKKTAAHEAAKKRRRT